MGRGSLAEERPDLVQQWDSVENGDVSPAAVQAGSQYRAAWQCGKLCKHCGAAHAWQARTYNRKVCRGQSLAIKRPDLMQQWDWEKNGGIDPLTLGCFSHKKVVWICPKHGSWEASVNKRSRGHRLSHRGRLCSCAWLEPWTSQARAP